MIIVLKKSLRFIAVLTALLAISISFFGCKSASDEEDYYVSFSLPGTFYVNGTKLSGAELSGIRADISSILHDTEKALRTDGDSDSSRIGDAAASEVVKVGEDTRTLLSLSQKLYTETGGSFSPALYNLSDLWGFSPSFEGHYGDTRPEPSAEAIEEALRHSQLSDIQLTEDGVVKSDAQTRLDFGGIAKGYMCDLIIGYFREKYAGKALNGTFSVMSSGTVLLGEKIEGSGTRGYTASIENPRRLTTQVNDVAFLTGLSDVILSTSADTYRFYAEDGKIYSHIIDPHTGRPSDNGVISITIIMPLRVPYAGAVADAYSTAGFCMPLTEALAFYESAAESLGIGAVVVTSDFRYYVSGDYNVLTRREYAQLVRPDLAEQTEDVFTRAEVSDASDTVIPCAEEEEYISFVEERAQ